jgi:hypothetical protein
MVKTTVELTPVTALLLERLAEARGCTTQELIREALEQYTNQSVGAVPSRAGRLRSGHSDTSSRVEELLDEAHERGEWP